MFQYAYALALSNQGYDVKICANSFDTYKLHEYNLEYYNINLKTISKDDASNICKNNILKKIAKKLGFSFKGEIIEKEFSYDESILHPKDNNCIYGYFQSEKYFLKVREALLGEFTLKNNISKYGEMVKDKVNNSSHSCSVHIRRGDYLTNSAANKIHGVLDLNYYKKAIKLLEEKQGNIQYFIFSDDVQWARKSLNIENSFYVDGPEKRIPNEDIYLMSLCNYNITANSTFSWWGAWLNNYNNKVVISPKQWFSQKNINDRVNYIIPPNWIRI